MFIVLEKWKPSIVVDDIHLLSRYSHGKSRSLAEWQADLKGGSRTRRAFHRNLSSVCLDNIFHDREPEPRSARIARAVFVNAIKPFKDVGLVAEWDARPVVGKSDADIVFVPSGGDG